MITEAKLNKIVSKTVKKFLNEIMLTPAHVGAIPDRSEEIDKDYDDGIYSIGGICYKYVTQINYLLTINPNERSIKQAIHLAHEAKMRSKKYSEEEHAKEIENGFEDLESLLVTREIEKAKSKLKEIWENYWYESEGEDDTKDELPTPEQISESINTTYNIENIIGTSLSDLIKELYKKHGVSCDFKFMGRHYSMRVKITYNEGVSVIIKTHGQMIKKSENLGFDNGQIGGLDHIAELFRRSFISAMKTVCPEVRIN